MPLTPEEQRELNRLEQKYGQAPAGAPSGLGAFLSDLAAAARVSAKSSGLPSPLGAAIPAPIRDVAVRTATTAALPTLLGAGGAAAGALTGPAAPVAIPLLEAAGSAGGEYLNQALGITPRSRTQIALAAGLPLGFRAIGAGVNALARRGLLPGAQGGLHELAAQEAPELAEKLRPTENIDDLYAIVRASTDRVPLTGTAKALKDVSLQFNRLLPSQQPASIRALLDDVAVMTDQNQTGFAVMFERAKAMGAAARAASGTEQGIYKRLFKGMMEDLETAAGSIPALKRATSAFRKNLAADELLDLLLKAKGQPQRGTGVEVIAAGKVLK
ncbi:MAG TPA: hypothetical protein VNN55_03085, partial [bacterium]|nr:hypothetical protein [bacterium]